MKRRAIWLAPLFKTDSNTGVSCKYCEILKTAFFRTPPVAASELTIGVASERT